MNSKLLNHWLVYSFFGILLLTATEGKGQAVRLSEDPGQFMTELKTLMEKSGNPAYAQSAQKVESIWMNSVNATQQKQTIGLIRRLAAKGQKAGPVFHLLLENLYTTVSSSGDVNGFLIMIDHASDKYDGKALQKLLETVRNILDKKQLYSSNYCKLYLTGGQYRFRFDDSKPDAGTFPTPASGNGWDTPPADSAIVIIEKEPLPTLSGALLDLQNATFAMVSAHDSVTFGPSEGSVSLRQGTFVGKNGQFAWPLAGDSSIYVDLNEYSFNIATPQLKLSNATLHYPGKLKNTITGAFEFKSIKHIAGKPHPYPRFTSHRTNAQLTFPGQTIDYRGGLSIIGSALYSTALDKQPSYVTVKSNNRKVFEASSLRFALKDTIITADIARFTMPLGKDSLFHPGVRFRYSDENGALRLERADKTVYGDLPYLDSYHKMGIWAEAMRWDFTKEKVEFYMIAGKQVVPVRLESFDYFKPRRFQAIAEEFGFQPLLMAANFVQTKKRQSFTSDELAAQFKQNPVIVKNALEQLAIQGYFIRNDATMEYRVTQKGILYILANFDKGDYDNFQILSQFEANKDVANATISLKDTLLTVRGVDRFVVSDSLKIYAAPSDKQVVIGKNRDFVLNGQLRSANFRFAGQNLKLNYDQFFVNLNQVDSITYTPQEKYAKGLTSEVGGHVKYEKGGTFYLSDPKNKSGHQKGLKSPRLVVPEGMTVYFDQPVRGKLQYSRDVFFKIPKLDFDSLDRRDVVFDGTFNSGGILPPFKTILKSMPDNSLGFEYQPPAAGLKIYEGKASLKFTDKLVMDNSGLQTKGVLNYLSASFPAESMLLMSDSLTSSGTDASIKEATIGKGYFPGVTLKNYSLRWTPKADSMLILTKGNSSSFYKGTTQLEGGLLLRSSGLYGNGILKRKDSEVQSADIKFNKDGFYSKKSQFTVKEGKDDSFRAILLGKNVEVDFNVTKGLVDLTTDSKGFSPDSSSFEFPYAAYRTSIDKARWNINSKTIAMKGELRNSTFTATAADQEGLTFNATAAVYEIDKMMLNISGVPHIRTADVKIIPDKGVVSIRKNGEMQEFKKARIEIDTLNSSHRMRDATIRITSRNRFEGSATYQYITARKDTFNIKMENFELHEINTPTEKSRKGSSSKVAQNTASGYYTTARAAVTEEEKLTLSPRIQYKGDVKLIAYEPSLQLDGFVRPLLKNRPELTSSWISYKDAPGKIITIKVNKNLKSESEQPLFAGLHFSQGRGMYVTFLSPKENDRDQDIYVADGEMSYDETGKAFRILPPSGADSLLREDKAFTFNDQKGLARFTGPLQLSSSEWLKAAGTVTAQVDSSRFDFNTMLLLNLPSLNPFTADLAKKIVQTNLDEQNSDPAESDASRLNRKMAVLIGEKAAGDYMAKTAGEYKPLYEASASLDVPMIISNVDLRWSDTHGAFYSTGPIGISNLGRNDINAQMEGMLEIRRTDRGDEFSMYLEVSPDVWFYFGYSMKQLGVLSSDMEINDVLLAKSKNAKTKDMELIPIDLEEKNIFLERFNDFYQPAIKKAKVKAAEKKEVKKKTPKKKEEAADGF